MNPSNEPRSRTAELEPLAADADAIVDFLDAHHRDGGDIDPEALGTAERLRAGLRDVIAAATVDHDDTDAPLD